MGRIRTIKPDFSAHEELSALPAETHLLAAALLTYADDEGYFNANPVLLKAGTTPLRVSDKTRLEEQVSQLQSIGYIEIRRDGLKAVGHIVNFLEHQRVSHPTPSKLRDKFEELQRDSGKTPEKLRPEGKGIEGNGTGKGKEGGADAPEFVLPAWVDAEAWNAFLEMRKANRKPITEKGKPLAIAKLDALRKEGHDPKEVLNQSTMNSWQGLFEIRESRDAGSKQDRSTGARPSPAVQRGTESRTNIGNALARRLAAQPGPAHGRNAGELPQADTAGRNAGHVAGAVGGDGGSVRDADVSGRPRPHHQEPLTGTVLPRTA